MLVRKWKVPRLVAAVLASLITLLLGLSTAAAQVATSPDSTVLAGYRYYDRPIDPDRYIVRPGEELVVTFVNTNLPNVTLAVGPEGQIVQRNLGVLDVAGKSLNQVRSQLHGPLSQLYNADEINISVSDPYVVWITVSGAVNDPGSYMGYTSQRVSEILEKAGGVSGSGSTRNIVFKGGPDDIQVDIDRTIFLGDDSEDPCLYSGTTIIVPERSDSVVSLVGEVKQPRMIELTPGDNLDLLIKLAGGAKRSADLSRTHVIGDSTRDISSPGGVRAGDVITVPAFGDRERVGAIVIFGAVTRPGRFQYREGLTLGEVLDMAGGMTSDANSLRITVFRRPIADQYGRMSDFRFPIGAAVNGNAEARKIPLNPYDSVFVPRVLGFVQVSGMVRNPGYYPFTADRDAGYYIELAGGFASEADKTAITIFDRVAGTSHESPVDAHVGDGDEVVVNAAKNRQ